MYKIIIGRDEDDRKKYGLLGTVLIAKQYVKMGQTTSLSNPVYLDISRSHVIFICGKRGSGKCLTGDALVTLEDGSEKRIDELKNTQKKVISLNDNFLVEKTEKEGFFEREVDELLLIKLNSGKEIKLTPEHPLLTKSGWIPAKYLRKGERIATPSRLPFFGNKNLTDEEAKKIIRGLKEKNHNLNEDILRLNEKSTVKLVRYLLKQFKNNKLKIPSEKTRQMLQSLMLKLGIITRTTDEGLEIISTENLTESEYSNTKILMKEKLIFKDIFWDEIESVESLKGKFKVYDISVPKNHNFIANNIIVHNSYTMGVIAESIADMPEEVSSNISIIMLDTMGIYWTMKYPNKKDEELLKQWGLTPKGLNVKIFTPKGFFNEFKEKGIPTDYPFSIQPSELTPLDWARTFNIDPDSEVAVFISRVILKFKEKGVTDFSIEDIIKEIEADTRAPDRVKLAAENHFIEAKGWGLFDAQGTKIDDLVLPGQVSVLDVSCYVTTPGSQNIRALVIGLVAQKLFVERMVERRKEESQELKRTLEFVDESTVKQKFPLVWLVIDEAHEFLPREGKTVASDPLITILREGRQPGISLILASQQPGKIHTDVMTQSDIVISHRLTAEIDVKALGLLMQSYMHGTLEKFIQDLPRVKGAAVVFDDTNERMFPIRIRPRITWHGGSSPTAIHKKQEVFGGEDEINNNEEGI